MLDKSKLILELKTTFLKYPIPRFEKVLDPLLYSSVDDEHVKTLEEIYPFTKIDDSNQYDFDNILLHCTATGYRYIIPFLLEFFLEDAEHLNSNLFGGFEYLPSQNPLFTKTLNQYIDELTIEERKVLTAVLEKLECELNRLKYEQEDIQAWQTLIKARDVEG